MARFCLAAPWFERRMLPDGVPGAFLSDGGKRLCVEAEVQRTASFISEEEEAGGDAEEGADFGCGIRRRSGGSVSDVVDHSVAIG